MSHALAGHTNQSTTHEKQASYVHTHTRTDEDATLPHCPHTHLRAAPPLWRMLTVPHLHAGEAQAAIELSNNLHSVWQSVTHCVVTTSNMYSM